MPDTIKVLFTDGSWIDFNKPQGFDMAQFVHGIRSIGMLLAQQFYIPAVYIKAILDMSSGVEINLTFGKDGPPIPNAPTSETKQ